MFVRLQLPCKEWWQEVVDLPKGQENSISAMAVTPKRRVVSHVQGLHVLVYCYLFFPTSGIFSGSEERMQVEMFPE